MISNNVMGLIGHVFTVIIMFLFVLLINFNQGISEILYGNFLFKVVLSLIPIIIYFLFGKLMSKKQNKLSDFFTGILIVAGFAFLFFIAYFGLGNKIYSLPVSGSMWKMPLDLFMLPQIFILKLFRLKYSFLTLLISALVPGIIYSISIKLSKKKLDRRKRIRERRNR